MDLKSRGQRGRSFIQRAIRRPGDRVSGVSGSNLDKQNDDDLTKKVEALFAQDLLFERLHTEPRFKKTYEKSLKAVKKSATYVKKQKFATKAMAVVVLSLSVGGVYQLSRPKHHSSPAVTTVAGANTDSTSAPKDNSSLPKESPKFSILMPQGRKYDDLDTLLVSPKGADPVYVFLDSIDGIQIKVSQQQVPKTFNYNESVELERVAKDFQATNIIQIDGNKVYHGLNEKTNVQSLIFIKEGLLVTISSSQKLSDDKWTGYILGLQKH